MISVWVMNFCKQRSIRFCTLLISFHETLESSSDLPAEAAGGGAGAGGGAAAAVPALPLMSLLFWFEGGTGAGTAAAGTPGCGKAATGVILGSAAARVTSMATVSFMSSCFCTPARSKCAPQRRIADFSVLKTNVVYAVRVISIRAAAARLPSCETVLLCMLPQPQHPNPVH